MTTELVTIGDIERMAAAVAKSGLFGVKQPEQAMALMLVAQAEGLHPAGLMLTLQQLRRAGTSGDGVPADDHSLPGTVF